MPHGRQSHVHADLCQHLWCTVFALQPDIQAIVCKLPVLSIVLFPLDGLLACHLKPVLTKTVFVQVCSESVSHAETVPLTYNSQQAECGKPLLLISCASTIC